MRLFVVLLAALSVVQRPVHLLADEDYGQVAPGGQLTQLTGGERYEDGESVESQAAEKPISAGSGCPSECSCNRQAQIADCSSRSLLKVPSSFPRDIKRIQLQRNNITELGPYAFKGLKQLQRIDLSNNKLTKIDPMAFAGNLQSLSSLILYSNRLSQLPAEVFSGLNQLQLLLLNGNNLKCISKKLFKSLSNLNLLSLYDNQIESLSNGTFEGLQKMQNLHLGKNPLNCDCRLTWLANYLEANPVEETSRARCERPSRNQGKLLSELSLAKFRCEGNEESRSSSSLAHQCEPESAPQQPQEPAESCPAGCQCDGFTVDCSRASQSESRSSGLASSANLYELPDVPDDLPVYVTRLKFNDNRIKRIRQTGLFRRLANSRKLDLGSSKIVDIEDNYISAESPSSASSQPDRPGGGSKPERVVFVLLENDHCDALAPKTPTMNQPPTLLAGQPQRSPGDQGPGQVASRANGLSACSLAPKVTFDSPCYNGGSCVNTGQESFNFSCLCPPGFAGPLCEINLDDCQDHQCQNGAACVDGVNSYRCVCRDPTTSGEFCEQLNLSPSTGANSISGSPLALPMVANSPVIELSSSRRESPSQISARSADSINGPLIDLVAPSSSFSEPSKWPLSSEGCRRVTQKRHYEDGNGCRSVRQLKLSTCQPSPGDSSTCPGCCIAVRTKQRRVRMQCHDGASYVKSIELIRKCACSPAIGQQQCPILALQQQQQQQQQQQEVLPRYQVDSTLPVGRPTEISVTSNGTQEDQALQISRLDGVD